VSRTTLLSRSSDMKATLLGMAFHCFPHGSIHVKHFAHLRPPFSLLSIRYRLLHALHDFPPFLGLFVRGHFGPVALHVAAVIFEVTEQDAVLEVDGVVANIALPDHVQHLWPDRLVILFVGIRDTWFETQSHSEPSHFDSFLIRVD